MNFEDIKKIVDREGKVVVLENQKAYIVSRYIIEETKEEVKEESEKEPEKQESIINKDVFLKKYKMVDPDDDKGVEKKKKKKIKVSLTSKD